ncbi:MAG: hypothetical protein AAGF91_11770 [Actinomycetota bacterium]
MAEAWKYAYTDFGEGRGRSPQPVLRAVVSVATPGSSARFAAIIDTGGPITVVAADVLATGGSPVERDETMLLRLGGATNDVALHDLTLEVRPPSDVVGAAPVPWRGIVAVLDPWPHRGTAVILGQSGFLDTFTVTLGPDGFALEPASVFGDRFPE